MRRNYFRNFSYLSEGKSTTLGTTLEVSIYMRLVGVISIFIMLWGMTADAKVANSCSSKFKKHRVFSNQSAERATIMKETLVEACEVGLSDSQIAGKVLKSCMKTCDVPQKAKFDPIDSLLFDEEKQPKKTVKNEGAQCKQSCFGSIQKMAKETQRLKRTRNAKR